jgi:hypothetical protein
MDVEARLRKLEIGYRLALSSAVAAKAHYLGLLGSPSATPASIERARQLWQQREACKRAFAARMGEVEDLADERS